MLLLSRPGTLRPSTVRTSAAIARPGLLLAPHTRECSSLSILHASPFTTPPGEGEAGHQDTPEGPSIAQLRHDNEVLVLQKQLVEKDNQLLMKDLEAAQCEIMWLRGQLHVRGLLGKLPPVSQDWPAEWH